MRSELMKSTKLYSSGNSFLPVWIYPCVIHYEAVHTLKVLCVARSFLELGSTMSDLKKPHI